MTERTPYFSFFRFVQNFKLMKGHTQEELDMEAILQPETPLERQLLQDDAFVKGLYWGVPRYGHPEGEIFKHIVEVLANIDRLPISAEDRAALRLITFSHDTFKYKEDKSFPRDWSKHHGVLARQFMEQFMDDTTILDIIELHDEAYYCWRSIHLYHKAHEGEQRLSQLLSRLGDGLQLFYLFFKCDTLTGDKNLAPLKWFEQTIKGIELVALKK
jgi:hypothetical protein